MHKHIYDGSVIKQIIRKNTKGFIEMPFVFRVLCLSFFGLLSGPMVFAAPPPIKDFINPAKVEVGSLQISPNGAYLSWVVPSSDRSSLVIYNRAAKKITANVALDSGQYVHQHWWSTDNRIVISAARKYGGRDTPFITGELWAIDADGQNSKKLFYRGDYDSPALEVLEPTADKDNSILVGAYGWSYSGDLPRIKLARMNLNTGRLQFSGGQLPMRYVNQILIDSNKQVRVIEGNTDEIDSILLYRNPNDNTWQPINDERKSKRQIIPFAFAGSDTRIYASVIESGKLAYLVTMDLETGKESLVFRPDDADIGGLQLTADEDDAYAVRTFDGDGRGGFAIWNKTAPEAILHKELFEQFPGELIELTDFSRDAQPSVRRLRLKLNH